MPTCVQGLPVIHDLNNFRDTLFQNSGFDTPGQVTDFLGHKAISVILIPANLLGTGIGITAMTASACTIGALKVAIFAVSLGNKKWHVDTGFIKSAGWAAHSFIELGLNTLELLLDIGKVNYQVFRLVRFTARTLRLEGLFTRITNQAKQVFQFIDERLTKGATIAYKDEPNNPYTGKTPSLLAPLNAATQKVRPDYREDNRLWSQIFQHTLLSAANIPVNAAAALCSTIATTILGTFFITKIALYAATNIHIPIPTFAAHTLNTAYVCTENAAIDSASVIGDGFISIYKVSDALGIVQVVIKAMDVLRYIPEALCNR